MRRWWWRCRVLLTSEWVCGSGTNRRWRVTAVWWLPYCLGKSPRASLSTPTTRVLWSWLAKTATGTWNNWRMAPSKLCTRKLPPRRTSTPCTYLLTSLVRLGWPTADLYCATRKARLFWWKPMVTTSSSLFQLTTGKLCQLLPSSPMEIKLSWALSSQPDLDSWLLLKVACSACLWSLTQNQDSPTEEWKVTIYILPKLSFQTAVSWRKTSPTWKCFSFRLDPRKISWCSRWAPTKYSKCRLT